MKNKGNFKRAPVGFKSAKRLWTEELTGILDTELGQIIKIQRENLIRDIVGDESNLTESMNIILSRICEKNYILGKIGEYIFRQDSIIDEKGDLAPCISNTYVNFSNSIRSDLDALNKMAKNKKINTSNVIDSLIKDYGVKKE
jgi:hypothetical protein